VPGRYVGLRVRDTGHGMDAAARAHAFEPFFTTKAVGAGTGLGLATVFGIVRQAGGALRLDSAPGQGTTVTVLLPAAPDGQAADPRGTPPGGTPRAGAADGDAPGTLATVLLVEDEAPVRATARRMLERHGYRVLEARHGADALLLWREHAAAVDVAVTDLRMPELGGRDLVTRLRAERPGLPVVFMSGYADQVERAPVPGGDRRARQALVEKPFTAEALLAAVARVLRADRGA
jgi:CheY-like chemotaxis protein